MPVVLLERIPLPSLRTYTGISVLLVALAVYFAHSAVNNLADPNTQYEDATAISDSSEVSNQRTWKEHFQPSKNVSLTTEEYLMEFSAVILQEPWCVWVMINMAYCCLILYGKLIQKVVFGALRVSEQQHLKDKFWNFIFYKFIFIFGVMNVQTMEEIVLWCAWFTALGFLHLLSQLSKDRFEYLCSSPSTPVFTHMKLLTLLIGVSLCCILLMSVCVGIGFFFCGINTFAFMAAECILLLLKTMYVIIRYVIQLWDENRDGVWENRAIYVYYTELVFELAVLSLDFTHHLHMLLWGNIFLSMASLVICMQLRFLFHEFQRRIRRHKNYKRVIKHMQEKFPMATKEELEALDDGCAICWERMEHARKLPCNHYFHNSCLRSWLEQDTTCPTCRKSIGDSPLAEERPRPPQPGPAGDGPGNAPPPVPPARQRNHFFHFDGSRYVSWLPSFSVEVRHSHLFGVNGRMRPINNSQLDNMARQVRDVFPDAPLDVVLEDLQRTRSVEVTIENFIDGTVQIPQAPIPPPPSETDATSSSVTLQPPHDATNTPHTSSATSQNSSNLYAPVTSQSDDSDSSSGGSDAYMQRDAVGAEGNAAAAGSVRRSVSGFWDHLNIADVSTDESGDEFSNIAPQGGSRFSKAPRERESMLRHRRKTLIEQAKKQFMQRKIQEEGTSVDGPSFTEPRNSQHANSVEAPSPLDADSSTEPSDPQARRQLLYEATRRRMQPN